jgi:class 3 adenylate cyclase/Tfp pilus assembly protein PilF
MSGEQRRLAAVMFTDIVGYSSLAQKNEQLALEVLEEHREIVRRIVARYNGREVKTMGDAFLIQFDSALEAAQCAVKIQRTLHDYNQRSVVERRVHLRIGVHVGDVLRRQNDILGDAVNIASRIEPLAQPDEICISQQVFDQVRNKIDCAVENLGPRQLKNIEFLVDVYRILPSWEKHEAAQMRFRGTTKSVGEIGKELKSGTVVEGSVRKAANRLRVTTQLIDATSEEHLWVQNYDRPLEDIFAIQTEVAQNVADALKMQLLEEERQRIGKRSTEDIGAYTFYLKGRYYWNERSKESLEKAAKYFDEAIKRDPGFALAYSGLADCYTVLCDHGYVPPSEGYPKAKQAATKALELDDTLAEAHTSLGTILSEGWEWIQAESEFDKALKLNPNYATAHHWYSVHLLRLGRLDEAIREAKVAEELDPLSPMIHAYAGSPLYATARQYDIALEELDKSLELDPNFVPAHAGRCHVCVFKSMFEEALMEMRLVLRFVPSTASIRANTGAVYATLGRTEEAKQILRECEEASAHEYVNPQWLAVIHSKLGNKDRALEWLEKAFEARAISPFEAKLSPWFDAIISDPRFDQLFKKTGAAERAPRYN